MQKGQGAKVSPNLAKAVIEKILQDIDTDTYMDNCCLFTNKDFEILHGPIVCLRDIMTKRVKRKNIQLIRKTN